MQINDSFLLLLYIVETYKSIYFLYTYIIIIISNNLYISNNINIYRAIVLRISIKHN